MIVIMIMNLNLYSAKTIEECSKALYIKLKNIRTIPTASLKNNVLSCFLKMARLLLVLIVNGSEFHKIGAARGKA